MKNTQLKFLANLAKQRLMNQDYGTVQKQNRNKASSYFIQNAKALQRLKAETNYVTIKNEEDIEFVESVKKLLMEDCYNPLGRLSDNNYFQTLDEGQKEFYILTLSEKYNKVKNEVMYG